MTFTVLVVPAAHTKGRSHSALVKKILPGSKIPILVLDVEHDQLDARINKLFVHVNCLL